MYCANCKQYVADGSAVCPHCGSPLPQVAPNPQQQTTANYFNQAPQQPQYQPPVQQGMPYNQGYQPNPYQQANYQSDLSTAKTLAIVALVTGIIGFSLVAWICGGIAMSKFNAIPDIPPYAVEKAKGKKMALWGIIIPFIWIVLAIVFYAIIFAVGIGAASYY